MFEFLHISKKFNLPNSDSIVQVLTDAKGTD